MRRLDRCDLRVLAEELPATLFVAFNVLMAWMAWALYADVTRWRGLSAAGELASVPPNEPAASEAIMAGLPLMWLLGAVALGVLAAYWHLSVVGKSGRSDAARAGPPDRSSGGSRASAK